MRNNRSRSVCHTWTETEITAHMRYNERCTLAKENADKWFDKYLTAGDVTPELEEERYRIIQSIILPQNQR